MSDARRPDAVERERNKLAVVILRELVRDFTNEEYEGRRHNFSTRLDHLTDTEGDKVIAELERIVREVDGE